MVAVDMKMPENCVECRFGQGDYGFCHAMPENFCGYVNQIEDEGKPDWCPLRQVDKLMVEHVVSQEDIERFGEYEIFKYIKEDSAKKIGKLIVNNEDGNSHIAWLNNTHVEFDPSFCIIRGISCVVNIDDVKELSI